jgi:hypothetical protein
MALYHYSVQVIGRAGGRAVPRSIVAAAAYRAGVALRDDRLGGHVWDYTRKGHVTHREIMTLEGAPAWALDREALWNRVEASERRRDAQLAREVEGAIPWEIPKGERVAWVRQHLQVFVNMGMIVDYSIHEPEPGKPHFHALMTLRPLDGDAFSAKKDRSWNDRSLVETWRQHWESVCNQALEAVGAEARVSRLSLAAQGVTRVPQPKVGVTAWHMEARGVRTERGNLLREAKASARSPAAVPLGAIAVFVLYAKRVFEEFRRFSHGLSSAQELRATIGVGAAGLRR